MRLLQKDLKAYREHLYTKQKGICPLCNTKIPKSEAVLDHLHTEEGNCREVLHRQCNSVEGRIANSFKRYFKGDMPLEARVSFLRALADYWEGDYSSNPIHPRERSPVQREIRRLTKYKKNLKTKEAKDRCQAKIKDLKEELKKERLNCWVPPKD